MSRLTLVALVVLALLAPAAGLAQARPSAQAEDEIKQAARQYDDALRRGDVAAVERFWGEEYVFVNPRGQRVTRAERIANVRDRRTTFDTLQPATREERVRVYGDVAVHELLLTIGGRYSGQAHRGDYRALVVWVRRDGRWQQVASHLTAVAGP